MAKKQKVLTVKVIYLKKITQRRSSTETFENIKEDIRRRLVNTGTEKVHKKIKYVN